jgi:hypothetical protein
VVGRGYDCRLVAKAAVAEYGLLSPSFMILGGFLLFRIFGR